MVSSARYCCRPLTKRPADEGRSKRLRGKPCRKRIEKRDGARTIAGAYLRPVVLFGIVEVGIEGKHVLELRSVKPDPAHGVLHRGVVLHLERPRTRRHCGKRRPTHRCKCHARKLRRITHEGLGTHIQDDFKRVLHEAANSTAERRLVGHGLHALCLREETGQAIAPRNRHRVFRGLGDERLASCVLRRHEVLVPHRAFGIGLRAEYLLDRHTFGELPFRLVYVVKERVGVFEFALMEHARQLIKAALQRVAERRPVALRLAFLRSHLPHQRFNRTRIGKVVLHQIGKRRIG